MDIEKQIQGIRIVAIIAMVLGLPVALAAYPPLNGAIISLVDMVFWPIDGAQSGDDPVARLMLAIGGGIFVGFGAMWLAIAGDAYRAAPHLMRRVLITGALVWFVTDSTGSVLAGAPSNVLGNIGFLVMLLWPLRKAPTVLVPA